MTSSECAALYAVRAFRRSDFRYSFVVIFFMLVEGVVWAYQLRASSIFFRIGFARLVPAGALTRSARKRMHTAFARISYAGQRRLLRVPYFGMQCSNQAFTASPTWYWEK